MKADDTGVLQIDVWDSGNRKTFPVCTDSQLQEPVPVTVGKLSQKKGLLFRKDMLDEVQSFPVRNCFADTEIAVSAVVFFYRSLPVFSISVDIKSLVPGLFSQIQGKGEGRP